MLVDPRHIDSNMNGLGDMLSIIGGGSAQPQRISRGLYETSHFSFDHCLPNCVSFPNDEDRAKAWWHQYPEIGEKIGSGEMKFSEFGSYGVCDSPEQFMKHELGQWIVSSSSKYVVSFAKVTKADQSPTGGWRWHKWGGYIGVHEPGCEYLYDEGPEISEVYCYGVLECLNEVAHLPIEGE